MMNTVNTRNNNSNNETATALERALETIIAECKNIVKFSELEKLAIGTDCEGEYVCTSINITEQLQAAKAEVERLEAVIAECEEANRKTEEAKKKEKEQEEKFLNSLDDAGKEVLAYLEGLKTLAKGEQATLVHNLIKMYKKITTKNLLEMTANIAAYVSLLVREEDHETIDLLETITNKIYDIKEDHGNSAELRVENINDVLLSIQDIY